MPSFLLPHISNDPLANVFEIFAVCCIAWVARQTVNQTINHRHYLLLVIPVI
jgi:hypothetical protein